MFLRLITFHLVFGSSLMLGNSIYGGVERNCGTGLFGGTSLTRQESQTPERPRFQLPDRTQGLGWKRFVAPTAQDSALAEFYESEGLWYHGLREYFETDEREALMHELYLALRENVARGIYVKSDYIIQSSDDKIETMKHYNKALDSFGAYWFEFTDEIFEIYEKSIELEGQEKEKEAEALRNEMFNKIVAAYEESQSRGKPFVYGQKITVSADFVRERLRNPDDFSILESYGDLDPQIDRKRWRLGAQGYIVPKERGVIIAEDGLREKYRERADKHLNEGYIVTMKMYPQEARFLLSHGREAEGALKGATKHDHSRYRDKGVLDKFERDLRAGKIFEFISWIDIDVFMDENPDVARQYLNSPYVNDQNGSYIVTHDGIKAVDLNHIEKDPFILALLVRTHEVTLNGVTQERKQVAMGVIKGVQMGNVFGPDAVAYQPSGRELDPDAFRQEIEERYQALAQEKLELLIRDEINRQQREINTSFSTQIKEETERRFNEAREKLIQDGKELSKDDIKKLKGTIGADVSRIMKDKKPTIDREAIRDSIIAKLKEEARIVGKRNLDAAHMLNTAMSDVLNSLGIRFADTHMTSGFSRKRGAKYVPAEQFDELLKSNPKEPVVLTSGQWIPSWWKKNKEVQAHP